MGASLLLLAAVGLIIPALFHFTAADRGVAIEHKLSLTISVVLFAIYVASLLFTLKTHRHLFAGEDHHASDLGEQPWTRGASITVLTVVTILVAVMSEMLVGALESASHQLGLTQVFVGVILVALVGNAAEHSTAVMVADEKQDGSRLRYCGRVEFADCVTCCPIARLCQLFLRNPVGSDLHTVRGGRGDDLGPDRGLCGDGRRIELDGRCDVNRGVSDAGHRLLLPARLAEC